MGRRSEPKLVPALMLELWVALSLSLSTCCLCSPYVESIGICFQSSSKWFQDLAFPNAEQKRRKRSPARPSVNLCYGKGRSLPLIEDCWAMR